MVLGAGVAPNDMPVDGAVAVAPNGVAAAGAGVELKAKPEEDVDVEGVLKPNPPELGAEVVGGPKLIAEDVGAGAPKVEAPPKLGVAGVVAPAPKEIVGADAAGVDPNMLVAEVEVEAGAENPKEGAVEAGVALNGVAPKAGVAVAVAVVVGAPNPVKLGVVDVVEAVVCPKGAGAPEVADDVVPNKNAAELAAGAGVEGAVGVVVAPPKEKLGVAAVAGAVVGGAPKVETAGVAATVGVVATGVVANEKGEAAGAAVVAVRAERVNGVGVVEVVEVVKEGDVVLVVAGVEVEVVAGVVAGVVPKEKGEGALPGKVKLGSAPELVEVEVEVVVDAELVLVVAGVVVAPKEGVGTLELGVEAPEKENAGVVAATVATAGVVEKVMAAGVVIFPTGERVNAGAAADFVVSAALSVGVEVVAGVVIDVIVGAVAGVVAGVVEKVKEGAGVVEVIAVVATVVDVVEGVVEGTVKENAAGAEVLAVEVGVLVASEVVVVVVSEVAAFVAEVSVVAGVKENAAGVAIGVVVEITGAGVTCAGAY